MSTASLPPSNPSELLAAQPTVAPPADERKQATLSLTGADQSDNRKPPPSTIPGYEILGEIGRGGMGVVYKAKQLGLNRVVALKMIVAGPHAGAEMINRFRNEAEAVARLLHQNIIQIYDIGEHDGFPFFTLEYAEGGSLDKLLNGTPQPPRAAAQLVETLALAIQVAHEKGIVHRDLKPANILVKDEGGSMKDETYSNPPTGSSFIVHPSSLKITDFGLAKYLDTDSGRTKSGAIMGTPSYMAPEQAAGKGKSVGPAADIYALGAILYELLTGRPPFRAATPLDTIMQVVIEEPIPPTRLQFKVPRDLETICLKCLEKDSRKRYATAAELAEDLRRFQNDESIHARPTPFWERQWKWAKRRPALAALVFLFAVPIPCLLLYTTVLWRDAVAARDQADANAEGERRARADVEKEHARAQRHLEKALEAVDKMLTRVGSERMARVPAFQEEREAILKEALDFYQGLLRIESADPMVRRETARAFVKMAELEQYLGQTELAAENCGRAIAMQTQLAAEFPNQPDYRDDLAKSHIALGYANALLNKTDLTEKAYEQALKISAELIAKYPEGSAYRETQADASIALGFYFAHGQPRQAEANLKQALALAKQLAREHPESESYRGLLAASYNFLGIIYLMDNKLREADAALREGMALLQPAQGSPPKSSKYYDQALVTGVLTMGYVSLRGGKFAPAMENLQKGIALGEELLRLQPKFYPYRIQLAMAYYTMSTIELNRNRNAEAEAFAHKAATLFDAMDKDGVLLPWLIPIVTSMRALDLVFVVRKGDYTGAVASAEVLSAKSPPKAALAYNLACVYALAAAAAAADEKVPTQVRSQSVEKFSGHAMELLRKSREGYLNSPGAIQHMKKDTDLDSLRSRQDFKDFVAELEKK